MSCAHGESVVNRTPRHAEGGFTLTEMLVTIAVMGILLGITAPAVSGYLRSSRVSGASNKLVADIHYANTLAREQRRTVQLQFGSGSYAIATVSPSAVLLTRELPDDVTATASDTVSFYAWGLTDAATILVCNAHDSTTIRLTATGSVSRD